MGRSFTLRTVAAVAIMSVLCDWLPRHLALAMLDPWLAAVLGGCSWAMFSDPVSSPGQSGWVGIVALIAQKQRGVGARAMQLALDAVIVTSALLTVPLQRVLMSIVAVVVLNIVLATNHRPGRYVAQ